MKAALIIFPMGIVGGFVIGFIIFGQGSVPIEYLAIIAIIIAIATWFGSGVDYLGFLKDLLKEQQEKRDKKEEKIATHTTHIINDLEAERIIKNVNGEAETKLEWITTLPYSRHKKKVLQHLYTDQRDTFDLLNDTVAAEIDHNTMSEKLTLELIKAVKNAVITDVDNSENNSDKIMRFAIEIGSHFRHHVARDTLKVFETQSQEQPPQYYVTLESGTLILHYTQKEQADKAVEALNWVARDDKIIETVVKWRTLSSKKDKYHFQCEAQLEELFSSINSEGKTLSGACDSCKDNYDENERSAFKTSFAEIEKTGIYKEWFKETA